MDSQLADGINLLLKSNELVFHTKHYYYSFPLDKSIDFRKQDNRQKKRVNKTMAGGIYSRIIEPGYAMVSIFKFNCPIGRSSNCPPHVAIAK
jgi:hypothetical protein